MVNLLREKFFDSKFFYVQGKKWSLKFLIFEMLVDLKIFDSMDEILMMDLIFPIMETKNENDRNHKF